MKKYIRESLFQILFVLSTTSIVVMSRYMKKMVDSQSITRQYSFIYMISMAIFIILGSFYSYHQYKNTKNKSIFSEPCFEDDERETFVENKSRKTAYLFLRNSLTISILIFLFLKKDTISINFVLVYTATLLSITEIIKLIILLKEYTK